MPVNERRAALPFGGLEGKASHERNARRQIAKPGALEKTAREVFAEVYGEVEGAVFPAWTRDQLNRIKSAVIAKWDGDAESLHDFVEWYVRDWPSIRADLFRWMTKKPAPLLPSIDFLVWQYREILGGWNTRASREWIATLDEPRRQRYKELTIQQGLSHDAARDQMAGERERSAIREETQRKLAQASDTMRTAQRYYKEAEKLGRFSTSNPDPRSEFARKQREAAARAAAPPVNPVANPEDFSAFINSSFDD